MPRARGAPLPRPVPRSAAGAALRRAARFARLALPLLRAHAVEFYTRGLWQRLVAPPPHAALRTLRRHLAAPAAPAHWDESRLSSAFCEKSQKLIDVQSFALAARYYSLSNLGMCTPLEELLEALRGERQERNDIKTDEFMNNKKSHEVQVMSELIDSIANYYDIKQDRPVASLEVKIKTQNRCFVRAKAAFSVVISGIDKEKTAAVARYHWMRCTQLVTIRDHLQRMCRSFSSSFRSFQVIDIGSGKGYLSSFLSMHYNFKVYGIDSSNTNTHGAHERNRKLKKHWRAYESRARADLKSQKLEEVNDGPAQTDIKCESNTNEKPLNNNSNLQSQDQVTIQDSGVFTEIATSETSKQTEIHLVAQTESDENKLSENVLDILDILPADAVDIFNSSRCGCEEICEEEKARRKMASLQAKASKSSESNLYFPLTSYITAETELSDIITDLKDSVMVGLHTCGDLAPNTLRIFTAKPEIKAVCSVGCCYHLLSEQYENQDCTAKVWGFPMCQYLKDEGWCCGRNARMSACLALERVAVGQMLPTESLFYRAVLQVIIEENYGVTKSDRHVGKIFSKSSSFLDYVRKSLKKMELDDSKLSDSCIMDYYEKYKDRMNELEAFNMLKVVLAPCIEVLILLDRLCYLKEQDNIAWSGLVKLFDPVKSPRCYGIIALKKQA